MCYSHEMEKDIRSDDFYVEYFCKSFNFIANRNKRYVCQRILVKAIFQPKNL